MNVCAFLHGQYAHGDEHSLCLNDKKLIIISQNDCVELDVKVRTVIIPYEENIPPCFQLIYTGNSWLYLIDETGVACSIETKLDDIQIYRNSNSLLVKINDKDVFIGRDEKVNNAHMFVDSIAIAKCIFRPEL